MIATLHTMPTFNLSREQWPSHTTEPGPCHKPCPIKPGRHYASKIGDFQNDHGSPTLPGMPPNCTHLSGTQERPHHGSAPGYSVPGQGQELLAYQATIVRAERNYEGKRWVTYDHVPPEGTSQEGLQLVSQLYNEAFTVRVRSIARCSSLGQLPAPQPPPPQHPPHRASQEVYRCCIDRHAASIVTPAAVALSPTPTVLQSEQDAATPQQTLS